MFATRMNGKQGTRRRRVHLPMMEIPGRIGELPGDRDIVVVCRVGSRSAQVVAYLIAQGRDRVTNLGGGMSAVARRRASGCLR